MTDAPTPPPADSSTIPTHVAAPTVSILITAVQGADLSAALAAVARQVYEPSPNVVVVGHDGGELGGDATTAATLEDAIAETTSDTEYLWLLHSDARPRPDALGALVREVERSEAALGGSKLLVAGTPEVLESVGSATDVFGEPYSGLDTGEIDLQQYDVVREVAFVSSVSVLVRRDLAQGLRGLDKKLPPVAAGLDFSQRARLAGGKVVVVPSSEVYHQNHCKEHTQGWREQAGRLRAMVTAYSLLTLLWVLPYQFLNALTHSIVSLVLLRWQPLVRHIFSWLWNTFQLPSTVLSRLRFRKVRVLGDEELFRFQARGSVQLREVGSELSNRMLSVFDEDQVLTRGSRRLWGSSGIWGAVIAVLIITLAGGAMFFGDVPNTGFSFPFEPPTISFRRWFAGWNESGLGSSSPVHPSVALTGLVSWLWFGAEGAARTFLTLGFGVLGVVGMGRLAGRLGLRGSGRYFAGLALLAGPGTAVLVGSGSWLALAAAGVLPWAVRGAFVHGEESNRTYARVGWAVLFTIPVALLSPVLALTPLLAVVVWKALGGSGAKLGLGVVSLVALIGATPFLLADQGWLMDVNRRLGVEIGLYWPVLMVIAFIPLMLASNPTRGVGAMGAFLGLAGVIVTRFAWGGPGVEEMGLVLASFGAALLVAAGLDNLSFEPKKLLAVLASGAVLALSIAPLANGRLGLPSGDLNERIEFASSLADDSGPGRVLIASVDRAEVPGEARSGPGFWYRVIDGSGMTSDELWLPEERFGDEVLAKELEEIASGTVLRPGEKLAPFAIDWLLLVGPTFRLDDVLVGQLDLLPTPLDPESRVFENPSSKPMADAGFDSNWIRSGTDFVGNDGSGRIVLALNHDDGWRPESSSSQWYATVDAAEGRATFRGSDRNLYLTLGTVAVLLASLGLVAAGALRKR